MALEIRRILLASDCTIYPIDRKTDISVDMEQPREATHKDFLLVGVL